LTFIYYLLFFIKDKLNRNWVGRMAVEPMHGNLVFSGRGPFLQFYNPFTDAFVRYVERREKS
jgi:hypothetical protein